MARLISLVVLLAVLIGVGIVFYQVMAGFFVPLFLAILLVVMFRPVHQWYMDR
jgi:predicted PurR-regulated permease PerM